MRTKAIVTEDYTNYKVPALFIGCITCDCKCCTDGGFSPSVCINNSWDLAPVKEIDDDQIIKKYLQNPITHAVVFGLLEPILQYDEIKDFIYKLRSEYMCDDDVVIYTGYYEYEIDEIVAELSSLFNNIVIKFGRFIPDCTKHFDEVLGVDLASDNQYAKRIS